MVRSQEQGKEVQTDFARELGLPSGATVVNSRVWFQDRLDLRAVFVEQTPFYTYSTLDTVEHRFCAAQLVEADLASFKEVCQAFDISPRTLSRVRRQLRTEGIAGLVPGTRGPKTRRADTHAAIPVIVHLYQSGQSVSQIASQVGLSISTIRRVLKDQGIELRGRAVSGQRSFLAEASVDEHTETREQKPQDRTPAAESPSPTLVSASDPMSEETPLPDESCVAIETAADMVLPTVSGMDEESSDELTAKQISSGDGIRETDPHPVEATSIPYASPLDQFCAMFGLIEEAPVEFRSASRVPHAGVLLGLALLEDTHLLSEARAVYGGLKRGWYGLRSLLWTLVVMALLRIRRPEQIKNYDPAGLGCVLGLPRAAEVKTIRRKLSEVTERGQAAEWHRRLATLRAHSDPSQLATLYVDGHVRVYRGRHRLGKVYVSRTKSVARGETDYWLHMANGQPLLVIHDPSHETFTDVLLKQVVPEIRRLTGDRRVRIVFDREGWSKELFHGLLDANIDFVTYRKGSYEPLLENEFTTVTYEREGQTVSYELAESIFESEGWPPLRLIAKKKKNGSQTHILATGRLTWEAHGKSVEELADYVDPPAAEIAYTMFGRWCQENWFKYMMEEYALDVLVDYDVEADDPDRLVMNPAWRQLDRQVKKARQQHQRAAAKYTNLTAKQHEASQAGECQDQCGKCLTCRQRNQLAEVERCARVLEDLQRQRQATPKEARLGDVDDRDPVKLSYERKLFTDTVKLCAYDIETRLFAMLAGAFGRREFEGRTLIRDSLRASGDLCVKGGILEVHLEQLSTPRYTEALQTLCTEINALAPKLPETSTGLRFYIKPRPVGE